MIYLNSFSNFFKRLGRYSYEIPNYQRPYSWNQDNVSDLVNDINDAFENGVKEYFIGSIITIEKDVKKQFEVVDGQQRLTTITLIFSALRNLIKNETAKSELQKKILPIRENVCFCDCNKYSYEKVNASHICKSFVSIISFLLFSLYI